MLSSTVTVAVQVLLLPLGSVTVKVTVLVPRSAQVNEEVSKLSEATESLSLDPLSMSPATIVALPVASKATVKS